MSGEIATYSHDVLTLPEPWEGVKVRVARDEATGILRASITDVCMPLGVDPGGQVRQLQKAASTRTEVGYEIDPDALRKIELPPRGDDKPRARTQPHWCIDLEEVGYWVAHIDITQVNEASRPHLQLMRHALKLAATRLYFKDAHPGTVVRQAQLRPPNSQASADVQCAHCHRYNRVTISNQSVTVEKLIDV